MKRVVQYVVLSLVLGTFVFALPNGFVPKPASELKERGGSDPPISPRTRVTSDVVQVRLEFTPDISAGTIGVANPGEIDVAFDNVFVVDLREKPSENDIVWLSYELSGAADHDAVPRSINDQRSIGGRLLRRSDGWNRQLERISPTSLRAKHNIIRFGSHDPRTQYYALRDLKIIVEKGTAPGGPAIVITNASDSVHGGIAYIKGFVQGIEANDVVVGGEEIALENGTFEAVLQIGNKAQWKQGVLVSARLPDGRTITQQVAYGPMDDHDLSILGDAPTKANVGVYVPGEELLIDFAQARLELGAECSEQPLDVEVRTLRTVDLPPMPGDLVNVTPLKEGYRFLPDGAVFDAPARLTLPYDPLLIPQGYTPSDVRTYYFDEGNRSWIQVRLDTLLTADAALRSTTTHFTDYINGIIKVPESPETMGYQPTSIKDLKIGDASAGITPLAPPEASSTGAMSTRFPLKLPPGRQGMQPDLSLTYNSEGGHSWTGLGWNLSGVSQITIDTRWGVPRYDDSLETETYVLDGEMLTPVAHRTEWVTRTGSATLPKTFHSRVEGAFRRIQRYGDDPSNYRWEVTSKDGTVSYYGSAPGNASSAQLTDADGNIAKWGLLRVKDTNGNTIEYDYDLDTHAGTPGNGGQQLYLDRIRYTGHEPTSDEGKFSVSFHRDNGTTRPDVNINARSGLVEVTAHRLDSIVVRYQNEVVRSYRLRYEIGTLRKSLLKSIIERDKVGEEFYRHEFEYYDEVLDDTPYTDAQPWSGEAEAGLGDYLLGDFGGLLVDGPTSISGSWSEGLSFGGSLTVGPPGDSYSKRISIGGNYRHTRSKGQGALTLMDINGDNIPDKLFQVRTGLELALKYRPGLLSGPTSGSFGESFDLGERSFNKTKTRGHQGGPEVHPFSAYIGVQINSSETTTSDFLIDRNADGLMDLVQAGAVKFGRIDAGELTYDFSSQDTPNPTTGGGIAVAIEQIDPGYLETLQDENPLHDVVRVWSAPYQGHVRVNGTIQLLSSTDPDFLQYDHDDGVRAWVQFGSSLVDSISLDASEYDSPVDFPASVDFQDIFVRPGDRIYFRIGSLNDGAYDRVRWDPLRIEYLSTEYHPGVISLTDANGKNPLVFEANEDWLITGDQALYGPSDTLVNINGTFICPELTDDVHVSIVQTDTNDVRTVLFEHRIPAFTSDTIPTQYLGELPERAKLEFTVGSSSNVAWQKIQWRPTVVVGQDGIPFYPLIGQSVYPLVQHRLNTMFNYFSTWPTQRVIIPDTIALTFHPSVGAIVGFSTPESCDIHFTVKVLGSDTVGRQSRRYSNFGVQDPLAPDISLTVYPNDTVFVEFHIADRAIADNLVYGLDILWDTLGFGDWMPNDPQYADPNDLKSALEGSFAVFSTLAPMERIFGPQYRGWGQFIYRGNELQSERINENHLVLDIQQMENTQGSMGSVNGPNDFGGIPGGLGNYDPTQAQVVYMPGDQASSRYVGFDDLTYLTAGEMSCSRFGEDDLSFSLSEVSAQYEARVPMKRTESDGDGFSLGGSVDWNQIGLPDPGVTPSLGWSVSDGIERTRMDVFDVNGDRYPDNIRDTLVQFTRPTGVLESEVSVDGLTDSHVAHSSTEGFNASGSGTLLSKFASSKSPGNSNAKATAQEVSQQPESAQKAGIASTMTVSVGASTSANRDTVAVTWLDMNGDGLPDQVWADGQVKLNLGYHFGQLEQWGASGIRCGKSSEHGIDASLAGAVAGSLFNASIVFGLGGSAGGNYSLKGSQDVNGDGLTDVLTTDDQGNIQQVLLNTGAGFYPMPWSVAESESTKLDEGYSEGTSLNTGFTVCINAVVVRFCINPSFSSSFGVSGSKTQFMDMNGDGFADHVTSDEDGDLRVRYSTIGRTNLLKKVNGPLNANFEVDYTLTGNTYDLPQGKWVLSELRTFDGHSDDGVDRTLKTFSYAGGKYSRREREFYGFGQVVSNEHYSSGDEAIYRRSIFTYDTESYYTKGLLRSSELRDADSTLWKRSENTYEPVGADPLDDAGWAFPSLTNTREFSYEAGLGPLERSMLFDYDALGNVVSYEDIDAQGGDPVLVTIDYHDPTATYICNVPERTIVNVDDTVRRERTQEIDAQGNVTRIEQKIDDEVSARHDFNYSDGYGNLTSIVRPKNHKDETLTFTYEYDDDVHTHVARVVDSYGLSSSSLYYPEFGQLKQTTDINGQVTDYSIDDRGRIDTVTAPYERLINRPTIKVRYQTDETPAYAVVSHYNEDTETDIETVTFIDGLFRPIQVKKIGVFYDASNGVESTIPIISGRTYYDDFGRSDKQTYPFVLGGNDPLLNYSDDVDNTAPPTRMVYDILDRPLTVTLPDQSVTTTSYGVVEDNGVQAFRTRMIDAEGEKKDRITDVRQHERARIDYLDSTAITTRSTINGIGELQLVADVGGNVTTYTYDMLGRKLTYDHPDGGLTQFTYDPAGNLTHKLTAELLETYGDTSGAIKYTYEYERLRRIDYPDNYQNQVFYDYGGPNAEHGRAGRIWRQMDASGGQEFFYGPLGEVVKNIRTIIINQAQVHTYVWQQRYDSWNRVQEMAYPDGEIVEYEYNLAGKLRSMHAVKGDRPYPLINRLDYDQFEQRIRMQHGNGAETRYAYEPHRRRLSTLEVAIQSGRTIMQNQYSYDRVNNIMALANEANPVAGELGGTMSATYGYDGLYRLVNAQASYNGNVQSDRYELTMTYDNLHNIVHKEQSDTSNLLTETRLNHDLEYAYEDEQERPHVPSRIGSRTYEYDANGNLSAWIEDHPTYLSRDFHWDEENRLMAIRHNGDMNLYTYDAAGERALKSHGGMQSVHVNGAPVGLINHNRNWTAYVSPYVVVSERGFTKHYYIEGQRVASRIGEGQFVFGPNAMPGLQAGNWDYQDRIQRLQQAQNAHQNDQPENGHQHLTLPPTNGTNPYGTVSTEPAELPEGYGWSSVWGQTQITHPTLPTPPPPTGSPAISAASATAGYGYGLGGNSTEVNQYFYHPDHLGSATYITGNDGRVRQHIEYTAFGETFVEEHTSSDTQPYLYNGKELDSETGLYYYGARYYDPVTSIWASVDPMAGKYTGWSPYNYTLLNPLINTDPSGMTVKSEGSEGEQTTMRSKTINTATSLTVADGLAEFGKQYLTPTQGADAGKARTRLKSKSFELNPKLRTGGNASTEPKLNVRNRANTLSKSGKVLGIAGVTLAGFSDGWDLGTALVEKDSHKYNKAFLGLAEDMAIVGIAELGPIGAAFATGYGIGTLLESKFKFGETAGKYYYDLFHKP